MRGLVIGLVVGLVAAVVALLVFPAYDSTSNGYTLTNSCTPGQVAPNCGYVLSFSSTWNSHVSVNLFASPESTPGFAKCTGPGSEVYNATWYTGGFAGFSFVSSGGTTRCAFSPGPTPESIDVIVTIDSPIL